MATYKLIDWNSDGLGKLRQVTGTTYDRLTRNDSTKRIEHYTYVGGNPAGHTPLRWIVASDGHVAVF